MADAIPVQVCYAKPGQIILHDLNIAADATLEQAIRQSDILLECPEIDLNNSRVGIFGKIKPLDSLLRAYDRIEIYRPLMADPQETRRRRAAKHTST